MQHRAKLASDDLRVAEPLACYVLKLIEKDDHSTVVRLRETLRQRQRRPHGTRRVPFGERKGERDLDVLTEILPRTEGACDPQRIQHAAPRPSRVGYRSLQQGPVAEQSEAELVRQRRGVRRLKEIDRGDVAPSRAQISIAASATVHLTRAPRAYRWDVGAAEQHADEPDQHQVPH